MRKSPTRESQRRTLFRVICWQCLKPFRWTLVKCPRCMQRNPKHPLILLGKVVAVAALCVAVWYVLRAVMKSEDNAAGIIQPVQEKEEARDPRFQR